MENMKINHVKTREKCRILNIAELARQIGESVTVVNQVIRGVYPAMHSDRAQRIIQIVRDMGYLVEEPEDQAAA